MSYLTPHGTVVLKPGRRRSYASEALQIFCTRVYEEYTATKQLKCVKNPESVYWERAKAAAEALGSISSTAYDLAPSAKDGLKRTLRDALFASWTRDENLGFIAEIVDPVYAKCGVRIEGLQARHPA